MIRRPVTILFLLSGLNLLNYLDRFLLAAVGPKLQEDLGLSGLQFGLVINAFMLGYFVTSPLFGLLGDRFPRKGLITLGIGVGRLATAAPGLASSFGGAGPGRVGVRHRGAGDAPPGAATIRGSGGAESQ